MKRRFARLCALSIALGLFSLVTSAADVPVAATPAELRAALDAFLDQPRFHSGLWGVQIVSLDSGAVLFERNPELRLSPASNCKLYVAALALDRLGSAFRLTTPLFSTAPVPADGVIRGDVIVQGRGDPSWNPRRAQQEFWTAFDPFVAALRRAGVKRIEGDLVGDASYFHCTPQGAGWTADDLNDYYGAEISALTLDENYVDLRVSPADQPGRPCRVTELQPGSGVTIDDRAVTGPAGSDKHLSVLRLPGETTATVFGSLPLGGGDQTTETTVPRPAQWFAVALKAALERAGIEVQGRARSVRWPEPEPPVAALYPLGGVTSPPLRELIQVMLKVSQNLRTDLLFATLGEQRRRPDTPPWRTSDELALAALREFLTEHDLRPGDVTFDEGSGLSRNNLTTAAATVALLRFMAAHRERDAFVAALPVAGVDGTLRRRLKETVAANNVRAKTGTLRWANALSGYVTSASGEHLAFSLMLNRNVAPPTRNGRDELDEIALMLAQYRGR